MRDDLKISKIEERYQGHSVVVEITDLDKHVHWARGQVLFHCLDEKQIYGQGKKYHDAYPEKTLYFIDEFGNRIPYDIVFMPVFAASSSGELVKVGYNPVQILPPAVKSF
jgi:hypothetical protein